MPNDTQRDRRYWAFAANPRVYRVEDRVAETDTGSWRVQDSAVKAGDRGVVWKYDGGEGWRGIVALAEVLTDPETTTATDDPYWKQTERAAKAEPRVQVRTVRSLDLPEAAPSSAQRP